MAIVNSGSRVASFVALTILFALFVEIYGRKGGRNARIDAKRTTERHAMSYCEPRPSYCEYPPGGSNTYFYHMPWSCGSQESCFHKNINYLEDRNVTNISVNLTHSIYYYRWNRTGTAKNQPMSGCSQVLNVTWSMTQADLSQHSGLIGFRLIYTRDSMSRAEFNNTSKVELYINRTALPSLDQNGRALFYVDCIRPQIASVYRFELIGLYWTIASASTGHSKLLGVMKYATDCERYPEAVEIQTWPWQPWMRTSLTNGNSTVVVYFTPAAYAFNYKYQIELFVFKTEKTVLILPNITFQCNNYGPVLIHNLCPDDYQVKVRANCSGHCAFHVNFTVTSSLYTCPSEVVAEVPLLGITFATTVEPTSSPVSVANPEDGITVAFGASSDQSMNPKSTIVIVVASIVIVVSAVLIAIVTMSKRCKGRSTNSESGYNSIDGKGTSDDGIGPKKSVLLIYAKDNSFHIQVVRTFAAYLQKHCHCDVKIDLWFPNEISENSALDWILRQIQTVQNIIIINSEGGFRQLEAAAKDIKFEKTTNETPIEDMFLPAVSELRTNLHLVPKHYKVFKVVFDYTKPKHVIKEIQAGRTYRLMQHLEHLILNIHGLSKYSEFGGYEMVDVNHKDYAKCKEGQSLKAAIDAACDYFMKTPHWFMDSYVRKKSYKESHEEVPYSSNLHTKYDSNSSEVCDSGTGQSIKRESMTSSQMEQFSAPDPDDDVGSISSKAIDQRFGEFNTAFDDTMC